MLTISSEPVETDGLLVSVEDTGTGLDPAIADRIFDSFVTTKPEGMGMGLSICRSIIDAHGGRISASLSSIEVKPQQPTASPSPP
jgi:signal transduction histidine kinase